MFCLWFMIVVFVLCFNILFRIVMWCKFLLINIVYVGFVGCICWCEVIVRFLIIVCVVILIDLYVIIEYILFDL